MSRRAFRIYNAAVVVLCILAVAIGGTLGYLRAQQDPSEVPVTIPMIQMPETTEVPATTEEMLSDVEQKYLQYFQNSEYRNGRYTLQDLDDNGVPEMLIWPNEEVHEIVTIADGEPAVILSDYGLFLCEGNIVGQYGEGSGGCTVWYYEIQGSVAQPVVCIVWMFHEDAWYTSTDYTGDWDSMTAITKEQKREIVSQYLPLEKELPESGYLHFLYSDILN